MFKGKTRPGDDHVKVIRAGIENFDGGFRNRENVVAEPQVRILRSGKMTCSQFVAASHNYLGNNAVVANLPLKDAAKILFAKFSKGAQAIFVKDLVRYICEYEPGELFVEDSCFKALAERLQRIARPLGQRQTMKNAFTMFDNGVMPKGKEKMSMYTTTKNRTVRDGLISFEEFYHGIKNYVGNADYARAPKENVDHKDYLYEHEALKVWGLVRAMAGKKEGTDGKLTLNQVVDGLIWVQENCAGSQSNNDDDEVQQLAREHLEAQKLLLLTKIVRHGRQHSLNRMPQTSGQAELFEAVNAVEAMLHPFMRRRAERGQAVRHWDEWNDVLNQPRVMAERHNKWRPSDRDGCISSEEFYRAVVSFLSQETVERDMTDVVYADLDADSNGRGAIKIADLAYKIAHKVYSKRANGAASSGGGGHGGDRKTAVQKAVPPSYVSAPFGTEQPVTAVGTGGEQGGHKEHVPTVWTGPARDRMRTEYWTRGKGSTGPYYLEGGADDALRPVRVATHADTDEAMVAEAAQRAAKRAARRAPGGHGSDRGGERGAQTRRGSARTQDRQRVVLALSRQLCQKALKACAGTSVGAGLKQGGHMHPPGSGGNCGGPVARGRSSHTRVVADLRRARGGRAEAWGGDAAVADVGDDGFDVAAAAKAADEAKKDAIVSEWIWQKFSNFGGSYFGHKRHGLFPEQATVQNLKRAGFDVVAQRQGGGGGGGGAEVGEYRYSEEHDGRAPRFTKFRFAQFQAALTAALGRPVPAEDARALFTASAERGAQPNESGELEEHPLLEICHFGREVAARMRL
jgi:hypothetical protein